MYYVCHPRGVMIGMCLANMVILDFGKSGKHFLILFLFVQIFCEASQKCIKREGKRAKTIRVYDESENCHVRIPNCRGVGKYKLRMAHWMGLCHKH